MRFFLDNDVPVSVGKMLAAHGHHWWTAAEAGMADESQDDNLSVYSASKDAVLVTLDKEFMRRRRQNAIGRHVRLRCSEPEAAATLEAHLAQVLEYLRREHVTVAVSDSGVRASSRWG